MGNIYDGAFRTILNDCRQMIIPIINEIFKEDYTGNEIIEFHPNEHFIDQQDAADKERITDTNFIIYGKKKKKYHLECESSLPDGRMTIRLFEYDAQMVLVGLESPTWNFGTKIPCFILILISPMPRKERVHLRLTVCHQGNGRIWRLPGMWTMALDVGAGQKVCSIWYSIP